MSGKNNWLESSLKGEGVTYVTDDAVVYKE
jgi:hypothetical protein